MSSEEQRQSENERRIEIIDYLQANSWAKIHGKAKKINKSDVMRYMEDSSRGMTTHKIITDLIKEGKIKMIKDKPHSQTHYLDIDNSDDLNKANQGLAGVESDIKIMEISKRHPTKEEEKMLDILYWLIEIEKLPSKDKQMLYPKVIKVFSALAIKMMTAWGEARKQDREQIKKDYAQKTRRK